MQVRWVFLFLLALPCKFSNYTNPNVALSHGRGYGNTEVPTITQQVSLPSLATGSVTHRKVYTGHRDETMRCLMPNEC